MKRSEKVELFEQIRRELRVRIRDLQRGSPKAGRSPPDDAPGTDGSTAAGAQADRTRAAGGKTVDYVHRRDPGSRPQGHHLGASRRRRLSSGLSSRDATLTLPYYGDRTRWSKRPIGPAESDPPRDRCRPSGRWDRTPGGPRRQRWWERCWSLQADPTRPRAGLPATRRRHRPSDRSAQPIAREGGRRPNRSAGGSPVPRGESQGCACSHRQAR